MVNSKASLPRLTFPWTKDDRDVVEALRRCTGVRSCAEVMRLALREHYRAITGRTWEPRPEPPASGTDG